MISYGAVNKHLLRQQICGSALMAIIVVANYWGYPSDAIGPY